MRENLLVFNITLYLLSLKIFVVITW